MFAIPISYNVRNLRARPASTLMTALGIAAPVAVLMVLLGLVEGLQTSLAATGNPAQVLVMRKGATSELTSTLSRNHFQQIRFTPGIAKTAKGEPMASLEVVTVIMLQNETMPDGINITLRGLLPVGFEMREGVKLVEGAMFHPGSREVIVGRGIANRYPMTRIGNTLHFGRGDWTVVGVFDAGRSAANSEVFADLDQVASEYNRVEEQSSALLRVADVAQVPALIKSLETDKRFQVKPVTEVDYYAEQTKSAKPIKFMGYFISFIMAIGASFAAMNTMYAATSRRLAEIGTLRAIGFSQFDVLASFVFESLLLSGIGGLMGCVVAFAFNGVETGIGSFVTFSEITFGFHVGPATLATGLVFSVLMGFFGGFFPARSAARINIVNALRPH